jgi:hypothetical protein
MMMRRDLHSAPSDPSYGIRVIGTGNEIEAQSGRVASEGGTLHRRRLHQQVVARTNN